MVIRMHHANYQCKVQTYGFSRLINLLEQFSHAVRSNEDRTEEKSLNETFDRDDGRKLFGCYCTYCIFKQLSIKLYQI